MPSAGPDEAPSIRDAIAEAIGLMPLALFMRRLRKFGDPPRMALAVSGGPDSVALLLLAVAAIDSPRDLAVATVDHGLRPESDGEARQVAALCARLGVPHAILRVDVPSERGGVQAAARKARYAALTAWCPHPCLLTAHHRDDVAESLLMRLARGSGVRGLARMADLAELGEQGPVLLRPLLDWSKADLLAICARAGITTVRDPSNHDPRFERSAARAILAKSPWLDPAKLALSASHLAEADAALQWLADRCWAANVTRGDGELRFACVGLPHDTKRRVVDRILASFDGADPDRRVETMVSRLNAGEHATLGDVAAAPGPVWTFRRAPPRRPTEPPS